MMSEEKPVQLRDGRIAIVRSLNCRQRAKMLIGVAEIKSRAIELALKNKGINYKGKNIYKLAEIYLDPSDIRVADAEMVSVAMVNMVKEASFSLDTNEPLYRTKEEVWSANGIDVSNLFETILSISGLTSKIE